MGEKRILFDSSIANITLQGGGSLAVLAYLNAVLEIFPNRVDVITPSELKIRDNRFNSIDVSKRSKFQRNIGILQGKLYRSAEFIVNYLNINKEKYEWVFLNGGHYSGYIIEKIKKLNIKTAVFHHNYEPEYAIGSKSILSFYGRTAFWVKIWERKAYLNSTVNFFITLEDKCTFEKVYGKRDNNHYIGIYEPKRDLVKKPNENFEKSLVITCSLCDIQNVLSLKRFVKTYLNVFCNTLPDWKLRIMGRNPNEEILNLEKEYMFVNVFPSPPNIRELCSKSPIYLCQMDSGGGLKLRVMDGLRNGQAVLTHRVSARGFNVFFNEPFFRIYDDEKSFKEGLKYVTNYVKSNNFSREYIQNKYYEEFGFDCGINRLKNIINSIS